MADESIWKKEVSFGRKPKDDANAPDAEEKTSVWKREVSFGRKKKTDDEVVAPAPEPEVVAEEVVPAEETWTRAVSFGRKAQPEPESVAEEPVAEVEPVVAAEPAVVDEPVVAEAPAVVPAPEPGEPAEETWTRAVSFGRKEQPEQPEPESGAEEPVAEVEPVAAAEPAVVDEPVVAQQPPVTAAAERVAAVDPVVVDEPVVAEAPAVVPAPEPGGTESHDSATDSVSDPATPVEVPSPAPGVHAPVTADELAQLDEPQKKVPFWKKEIGGKKKDKAPKAKAAEAAPAEPAKKVPFWKKELGGKKKPKTEGAPPVAAEAATDVIQPEKSVPFWKKDFGGKKEKQPKQAKQPKVKAARGSRGAKRITGLKVGASQLAAARVANNGSAELLQVARTPLEAGIVVGGELRDPDALAEALKEFFTANNLPKKGVRLGIANNRIGVRTFDIAGIDDEKQLQNAVRFRAQEALPIPIDEAVLDYQVLGDGADENGEPTKRILLVVAYRELIDRYMDACKKAGISLVGIDLEAFALLRALQAPQDGVGGDSAAALVAVAIGHDRSTFAVSDGRICEFTRVLEWGGSALNVAIARALDAAPSEVDGVKRALALTDEMVPEGLTDDQAKKAREAMRRAIQTFARELVSSLQYYQNQPGSLGIGEIVLTGGTAHLSGLASELEKLIGVRVRVGDPLARMKVSKKVGEAEQVGSLAVAIGLGIED
jgi:type IV pilus assembly protein PilM